MDFFSKRATSSAKSKGGESLEAGSRPVRSVPWVEKYRPKSVNDVAYQDEVVAVLKKTIKENEFPNLLFYGPPGTGKTSTILAVARQLFGHDLYRSRVLELNASDERGIQVIREKVKGFAKQAVSSTRPDGSPCPPFKIIILDEADSMTSQAQAALRRTMEKETKTTRFCLICNYVSRIIEPLTSRCSKFRFKPLTSGIVKDRLQKISDAENVNITNEAMDNLIEASEGDLRKAITYLQSANRLKGEEEVQPDDIMEIAGIVPDDLVDGLIETCQSGSHEKLTTRVKVLMLDGYSGYQILLQVHDKILEQDSLTDNQKSVILERLAIADKCMCDGADEYLQVLSLVMIIMDQFCNH